MFVFQLALIGLSLAFIPLIYVWFGQSVDRFGKLVGVAAWLTFDLILFGSFTRLTDSGLGCPDWPGCYGAAAPFVASEAIYQAQAIWPQGPVTMFKAWVEMIHRYFAMALGTLIIAQLIWAMLDRKRLKISLLWPLSLLALICLQGAFGAWTVTLKLAPIVVVTHLLLGLTLLGALTWLTDSRRLSKPSSASPTKPIIKTSLWRWRIAVWLGLMLLILQIALGGWVSANYAMLACPDFPTCHGAWLPEMDFTHAFSFGYGMPEGAMPMPARVAVHWIHRTFAWVVTVYWIGLALRLRRFEMLRYPATLILVMIVVQCITGLSNIVLQWPLLIALAHNGGAAILLISSVILMRRVMVNHASSVVAGNRP
jgi:cytochrome c oxidase assembly protein subunit 15